MGKETDENVSYARKVLYMNRKAMFVFALVLLMIATNCPASKADDFGKIQLEALLERHPKQDRLLLRGWKEKVRFGRIKTAG